jgi:CHAT domain-containing protein
MSQNGIDRNTLKQYLLGELTEEELLGPIEERLLTDGAFFEEFQLVKDDLIDQYVRDEFSSVERRNFEQHFLTTKERRQELQQAYALARYAKKRMEEARRPVQEPVPSKTVRPRPRFHWLPLVQKPVWTFAVTLLLVAAVSFAAWRLFFHQSDVDRGLLALRTAYRLQRPVESRLSALDYAPQLNTRGNDDRQIDTLSQERAERLLRDAQHDSPAPVSDHALGLFYLTQLKLDQATPLLKKAVAAAPDNAQFHSDLGAALLEEAKLDRLNGDQSKSLVDLSESLEHLNRALTLNPSLLDALFNRALCHQYMELPQFAVDDWRQYLAKDSQTQWANEARQKLRELEPGPPQRSQSKDAVPQFLAAYTARDDETAWRLLSLNRDAGGSVIESELLDYYLKLKEADRSAEAQANWDALLYASELEVKRADDHFAADLVRYYQSLSSSSRKSLIEARALTSQGHQNLKLTKPEPALSYYTQAKAIFDKFDDQTESLYLNYPLAHAHLQLQESELSLTIFQDVVRSSEKNRYQYLLSQALSGVANAQVGLNDYSAALETNDRSREISERINDFRGLMKTADQLSILYTRLGNYRAAIERQTEGLALLNKYSVEPYQAWRSFFLMATPLHLLGLDAAAEDFERESLRMAQAAKNPYCTSRSYIGLGVMYGGQQRYQEALDSVRLAFDIAKTIPSEATKKDTLAYSSLQLGHLYRQMGDFSNAIASYDEVLKTNEETKYQAFVYAAHKGKLLSCIAQGGCPSVDEEVATTLTLFEDYRSKILEEENKFVFFDAEQNVYDAVIGYKHSVDPEGPAAFDLSERSHGRILLDLTNENSSLNTHHSPKAGSPLVSSLPLTAAQIRDRMPEHAQILQYSVLPRKILIWMFSRTNLRVFEQPMDAGILREKVSTYLHLLSMPPVNNDEEVRSAAEDFYDLLVKPAEAELDRQKQLCIVPDKALNELPFAAFISRASGKYLVQEYVLTRAPSATIFIVSSDQAASRAALNDAQVLSVGNPRFDHASFPTLGDLSSAKREAEQIATLYDSEPALTGDKALKNRVVAEMKKANVIHLALHAVVDEHSPLRSKLVFAADKSSDVHSPDAETLSSSELYRIPLPQTRLVVLSACQSASGRYFDGEGVVGISRPFIANGVPLVVASLWPVDSNATAYLMIAFHQNRKRDGLPTAEALAFAQREMLGGSDAQYRHPYYWASFVTIGGYARF